MKDGEFSYPEHPEESLPPWVFDLEDCKNCGLPKNIEDWMKWTGDSCDCVGDEKK